MRYGGSVDTTTLSRRRATGADIPLLRDLFADAHTELAVLPPDSRFVLVDMRFRAQRRTWARRHPGCEQQILECNGSPVGQLVLDRHAGDVRVVDLSIGLAHRREGIAAAALRDVCTSARRVRVDLWVGNAAGRALCLAAGFTVTAEDDEVVTLEHVSG